MTALCEVEVCAVPARHTAGCVEQCRGCLRALALDGLRLCRHHRDSIGRDAAQAAVLYVELELVLSGSSNPGEKTSGSREPNATLNERAAECRTTIRAVLVSWCRMIAEERGATLPDDTITAIARYISTHAVWLAAHPAAADCVDELHELAHGKPWRTAYPTGTRMFIVGACPEPVDDTACPGAVRAVLRRTDALLPSELACDTHDHHRWTADQWRDLARHLQPDGMVHRHYSTAEIADEWRLPVGTVHRLASAHGWRRSMDGRRPTLYVAADVETTMRDRADTPSRDGRLAS